MLKVKLNHLANHTLRRELVEDELCERASQLVANVISKHESILGHTWNLFDEFVVAQEVD
jgi:hypothetical protein